MANNCWSSRARVAPSISMIGGHTHLVSEIASNRTKHNNTIWRGSVLTGEEPLPCSAELSHALSQAGGPTQSQVSRPFVVKTLHHHGAPTTEPKYKCHKRQIFRKKKRKKKKHLKQEKQKISKNWEMKEKRNEKTKKKEKNRKRGLKGYLPRRLKKMNFF